MRASCLRVGSPTEPMLRAHLQCDKLLAQWLFAGSHRTCALSLSLSASSSFLTQPHLSCFLFGSSQSAPSPFAPLKPHHGPPSLFLFQIRHFHRCHVKHHSMPIQNLFLSLNLLWVPNSDDNYLLATFMKMTKTLGMSFCVKLKILNGHVMSISIFISYIIVIKWLYCYIIFLKKLNYFFRRKLRNVSLALIKLLKFQ